MTALALRRAGIEATVYEAYENTADGLGGMLMVAPNGLGAREVAGVDRGLAGQPIRRMVMTDGRGGRMGEFGGLTGLPPSRVMWRADLYRAVRERAAATGVPTVYGKRLTGVRTNSQKSMGPLATKAISLLMPLATRTFLKPERMFGWAHRYRIDWHAPVVPA
ncbi:FAD-dependent oxidoreductase [Streptomyces sp. NPDC007971]|uniref:FAD-dependent oxidoreductase n=1 Tax=Streptomyces sp. NPDC007971 TaxID=3364799 RepID=UPI0036ECEDB7